MIVPSLISLICNLPPFPLKIEPPGSARKRGCHLPQIEGGHPEGTSRPSFQGQWVTKKVPKCDLTWITNQNTFSQTNPSLGFRNCYHLCLHTKVATPPWPHALLTVSWPAHQKQTQSPSRKPHPCRPPCFSVGTSRHLLYQSMMFLWVCFTGKHLLTHWLFGAKIEKFLGL